MTPAQEAVARARGYALLGRLLLAGMRGGELASLASIPGLADGVDGSADPDRIAAEFVTAFDLGVPPYASAFLEESGHVGGAVTRAVEDDIRASGLQPWTDEVAADHLGVLLGHLGALIGRRAEAQAQRFASRWILPWLPSFLVALESIDAPFWRNVVRLSLDLLADQVSSDAQRPPRRLPVADDLLADAKCDLRAIAAYLASPARCGAFVTDADLLHLGRTLQLPRGFGHRRARIETQLRSAAEYEMLPSWCESLATALETKQHRLESVARPHLDPAHLAPWLDALRRTRAMLKTMADHASSATTRAL